MSGNSRCIRISALAAALGLLVAANADAANSQSVQTHQLGAVAQAALPAQLGLGSDASFVERGSMLTASGTRVVRLQQMYRGVPVFGHSVTVEQGASGQTLQANGAVLQGVQFDLQSVTPKLRGAQAIARLMRDQRINPGLMANVSNREAELFVYAGDQGNARLIYLTSYFSDNGGNPTRPTAIIDANTGQILRQWEGLTHAEAYGPGGNQKTGRYEYGTDYPPMNVQQSGNTCSMQNSNVRTIDLDHATSGGSIHTFTCPTNTYKQINGAFSPLNDAHFFGGVVYDMYQAYMDQAPLNFQLTMRVHYGRNYENAFWNGSSMTFGDGGNTFYPLVSLDVTAHEVSHGYTEQNSGLIYDNQSGGINEAYSDMAGEAAQYYNDGDNDFLVGAEIFKGNGALRYMCNPPQDGGSIDSADDYYDGLDVHYSSGVYNKAFCTLAQDSGWNTEKAFKVFATANDLYWDPNETFNGGANDAVQAACDLGYNGQDVVDAFAVVDVEAGAVPSGCGGTPTNDAPIAAFSATIDGLSATFTDNSSDPDGSIASHNWDFGDGNSSTASNPTHTYGADGTYSVTLTVTDNGGATDTATQQVTVGGGGGGGNVLSDEVPVNNLSASAGQDLRYTMEVPAGASSVTFTISGGNGDADLYVQYGSAPTDSSYDCRPYRYGNAETCTFDNPQAGTWHVRLNAYESFSGVTLVGDYQVSGGGGNDPQTYENSGNYQVSDRSTVESPIAVSGRSGNAPSDTQVYIDVRHTYVGDLRIDLVAPDGSTYNLWNRSGGSGNNVIGTATLDLGSESLNGTWKLRVNDAYYYDTGYINEWRVTF